MRYNRFIVLFAELAISASSIAQGFTDNGDGTWTLSSMPAYDINLDVAYKPIAFADADVKALCVANWDTDNDGELSEAEAAAVTNLGTVFKNNINITSFNELSYFTGLTSIEENAFYGCSNLTSLVIPNSVNNIGEEIIKGCTNLTSLTIPNSVKTIGAYAFWGSGLTNISIPNSVTSIGRCAFRSCANLESCTISNSITSIPHSLFYDCSNLSNVTIPNSVICIEGQAFYGCSSLSNVTIPNSVIRIEELAFSGCLQLASVTIGNSVTIIGDYSFRDCNSLTSVNISDLAAWCSISFGSTDSNPLAKAHHLYLNGDEITNLDIPNSVTNISNFAFYGCTGFTSVTIPNSVLNIGKSSFYGCTGLTSLTIPNSVTTIGDYAFRLCRYITSVKLGSSITSIGEHTFEDCSRLTSLFVNIEEPLDVCLWLNNKSNITLYVPIGCKATYEESINWRGFKEIIEMPAPSPAIVFADANVKALCVANWDTNNDGILTLSEAAAVTSLGNVFKDNTDITSFNELQYFTGLTSIGNSAFDGCSGLTSVTIPSSVTSIGNYAFNNCYSLTNLVIPDAVTSIGIHAFYGCSNLTDVTIPNSVENINMSAFGAGSGYKINIRISDLEAWNNIKFDENWGCVFYLYLNGEKVDELVIPNTITKIGDYAFKYCKLTSVEIPNSVTNIGMGAFYYSSLTSVNIPNSVTTIGKYAFSFCTSLTSVDIPNSVTTIKESTFSWCENLLSVTIPNSVETIETRAFYSCDRLMNISIGSSVSSIGELALATGCTLDGLIMTVGMETPVSVGQLDLPNNKNYGTLYVPAGCKAAYEAADYWKDFKEIIEMPAPSPAIVFADANVKALCVANWDTDNDGELSEAEAAAVTNLGEVFRGNTDITSFDELQYFNGLMMIVDNAFCDCSGLTSITIPSSVTSIGEWSFAGCSSLNAIVIPANVTSIYGNSFGGCAVIEQMSVASGNTVYDSRNGCNAIIETATNKLVAGCQTTQIPVGITTIGNHAFGGKWGMQQMAIPETVTTIETEAFTYCVSLSSITLPASISVIGNGAFIGCENLVRVRCDMEIPPTIAWDVFTNRANATLIVPSGSKAAYEAADYWKEFREIVGMTNIITNSDLEGDDVSCFYVRENMDVIDEIVHATIVDGVGKDGSRGIVVQSVDNPQEAWNTQFFVRLPQELPTGTKYRLSFDYKASQDTEISLETHKEPSEFITGISNTTFTTSWQHYESEGTITEVQSPNDNQMRTITFTLAYINTATTYYFDNIVFEIDQEHVEQPVTIAADNKTMAYGDDVPALTYTSTGAALSGTPALSTTATKTSPVGSYPIKAEKGMVTNTNVTYVDGELTIEKTPLTVGVQDITIAEGDVIPTFTLTYSGFRNGDTENTAFTTKPVAATTAVALSKAGTYPITVSGGESTNYELSYTQGTLTITERTIDPVTSGDLVINGDLEGDDVSCFYARENMDAIDEIVHATIVNGVGKEGSRGIVVHSVDNPQEIWTSQFFVRLPQTLPAGTKYRFSFDYKATQNAYVNMECHKEPSEHIYWDFGSMSFTTSWQHYESNGTITEEQSPNDNQMRTIAFNLSNISTATTYYFDNIVFEIIEEEVDNPDTDISSINNVVYLNKVEASADSQIKLSFKMKNTASIRGFQFDVYLPEGVTVVKSAKGKIVGSLSEGRLPEDDEHTLTISERTDGALGFLCGSLYDETFTGNDGEVATLTVKIAANMQDGDYAIILRNVKLTETDINNYYQTEYVKSTLTIKSYKTYTLGDINDDGKIDVSDYIGIANHILGNTPEGFVMQAADVNSDGNIDVSDYIGVANIILTGSIYGGNANAPMMYFKEEESQEVDPE